MSKACILIVDDEKSIRSSLKMILEYDGYQVMEAPDGPSAIETARRKHPDLVLLDIKMRGMDGLQVLESLHGSYPSLPVIILSGHGSISTAVQATKLGAYDFLEKPPNRERILITVKNALQLERLAARQRTEATGDPSEIIGNSKPVREVLKLIAKIAPSNLSVLIRGESGTGKELAARAIHRQSARASGPFVQVNCAAIPEDLIENELFGHEKGSYTGAGERRMGKFELAHQGTLFLDEIGDMTLKTQAKVLRALQEGEFQRVGGSAVLYADVRIIAATNQDLEEMIGEGSFREDLYFRINVVPLRMPSLREHIEDLPDLVSHFADNFTRSNGMSPVTFTEDALDLMKNQAWKGNVRDLKNFVERHIILSPGPEITASDIAADLKNTLQVQSGDIRNMLAETDSLQEFKETAEKQFLIRKLEENNWNIKVTAEAIGTPRSNLYKRMQYYGISRDGTV
ncbi:sigma-54-dependent Fis family transcriptional regulator [bacterium]|nr:sigma-54-dependent Fis family transcriptional regulator [candidate division CSSED10-310 bacterium]